jgi:hypothetical protein
MIIVDSAITRTKLPDSWPTLLDDASYEQVVGLEKNRVLSDEEWSEVRNMEKILGRLWRKRRSVWLTASGLFMREWKGSSC